MITVALPLPPSVNALYATYKGRRVKSKVARAFHKTASWLIVLEGKGRFIKGPWAIHVKLPASMRGDCDNRLKPILDAAVASGVVIDDRHCHAINVERTGEPDQAVITLRAA